MSGHGSTLGSVLRQAAAQHPARVYIRCGQRTLTFAQADALVDDLAGSLLARGVVRGTRVALLLPSIAEFPLYMLACARLGAITVPIGTRYTGAEIVDLLRRSRARILVLGIGGDSDFSARIGGDAAGFEAGRAQGAGGPNLPDLDQVITVRDPAASDAVMLPAGVSTSSEAVRDAEDSVRADDPVLVVYTSGTSGTPKGAVHTHNFLRNCVNMVRAFGMTEDDHILGHMPLYHVAGLCAALIPPLLTGASVVLVRKWEATSAAALIEQESITLFGGIPTHFIDLIEAAERDGRHFSTLRTAWIGGATISPDLAQRALAALNLGGLQAIYGMTETTSTTTLTPIGADIALVCENKGKPIGDFEIGVFDPESGALRDVGETGEVRVRGYLVMAGYLDDAEATAAAMTPDGWFRTGDLGAFDMDGYLQIRGRLKDVFRVGGSTVSPAEVESAIAALDGVRQVVVVGVEDDRLGEVGFAFVQAAAPSNVTREMIDGHLRSKLAGYKRPRFVRFIDEFPMTSTGKLQREVLRRKAKEEARMLTDALDGAGPA